MIREHRAVSSRSCFTSRRPLDVGEEEGDGAGGHLGHAARSVTPPRRNRKRATGRCSSLRVTGYLRLVSDKPTRCQYEDFVRHVLAHGEPKADRTGTGTVSTFGYQSRYDLARRLPARDDEEGAVPRGRARASVVPAGRLNVELTQHTGAIWDAWADADGELGPIYGVQWRNWGTEAGIDQIRRPSRLLRRIRTRAGSSSARGTSPTCRGWRCRRATRSSSSMSPAALGSLASSTSARPTSRSACRSTSRATRSCRT